MALVDALLPEFDHEMATTRKCLERLPDDKWTFKPHQKSMDLGSLASHLAAILFWVPPTVTEDEFDMNPKEGEPYKSPRYADRAETLAAYDENLAAARAALAGVSDGAMMADWSLKSGGEVAFTMPRIAVLRSFILSHNVHHRAQLGVYLRMNDVPVPAIYGPSADES